MAGNLARDDNHIPAIGGVDNSNGSIIAPYVDHNTKRLFTNSQTYLASDGLLASGVTTVPLYAPISASSNGDNTVIAAVNGKAILVVSGLLIASGTVSVYFRDALAGTALTGVLPVTTNSGFQIPFSPIGNFETSSGNALVLNLSSGTAVGGWLTYVLL